jgi:hypothetical protein
VSGEHRRSPKQAKKKKEVADRKKFLTSVRAGMPMWRKFFGAASIFVSVFRLYGCGGNTNSIPGGPPVPPTRGQDGFLSEGLMTIAGFSEFIEQSSVIRVELEALSVVMAVLSCMAIMAFIVYLVSVFYLWFMEGKGGRKIYERSK